MFKVKEGVLTYKTKGAETGRYTLKVSDKSGKYADLKTDFELTTEAVPVVLIVKCSTCSGRRICSR